MTSLLRPSDVATKLCVSRAWVYAAAEQGRIPAIRLGGEGGPLRFVAEDVEEWLDEARKAGPRVAEASLLEHNLKRLFQKINSRRTTAQMDDPRRSAEQSHPSRGTVIARCSREPVPIFLPYLASDLATQR